LGKRGCNHSDKRYEVLIRQTSPFPVVDAVFVDVESARGLVSAIPDTHFSMGHYVPRLPIPRHPLFVRSQAPYVTRHPLFVARHKARVTRHPLFVARQKARAGDPRHPPFDRE
jgi:hypothetical protein